MASSRGSAISNDWYRSHITPVASDSPSCITGLVDGEIRRRSHPRWFQSHALSPQVWRQSLPLIPFFESRLDSCAGKVGCIPSRLIHQRSPCDEDGRTFDNVQKLHLPLMNRSKPRANIQLKVLPIRAHPNDRPGDQGLVGPAVFLELRQQCVHIDSGRKRYHVGCRGGLGPMRFLAMQSWMTASIAVIPRMDIPLCRSRNESPQRAIAGVGYTPDGAADVVGNEQTAILRHGDAGRATPTSGVGHPARWTFQPVAKFS